MNKMTAQEILAAIKSAGISVRSFGNCNFKSPEGVGDYEEVEQEGGEGLGEFYNSIKYFKDHNVYIETQGYYTSDDGTEWDQGYGQEVFPTQVTVTQYVTLKPE